MPILAMVDGANTTYPNTGLALGAGNTFDITASFADFFVSDDDTTFDGDTIVNETPDDLGQTINIGGADLPIAYDFAFQASAGGTVFTFAVVDVDLNNDGDFGNGTVGGVDAGENRVFIAVLGPSTPVIPPGGLTFTITSTVSENTNQPFTNFLCFLEGTAIRTRTGFVPVEALDIGDHVWTEQGKYEPLSWVGARLCVATGPNAPIALPGTGFGQDQVLRVSPQHRVLLQNPRIEPLTGFANGLAKAKDLAALGQGSHMAGGLVSYHHILLNRHALVQTHAGHWAETLFPGVATLSTLDPDAHREVTTLFPDLVQSGGPDWAFCRPLLSAAELSAVFSNATPQATPRRAPLR